MNETARTRSVIEPRQWRKVTEIGDVIRKNICRGGRKLEKDVAEIKCMLGLVRNVVGVTLPTSKHD